MFRVFCLLIGYLCGCIQSAYLIGKFVGKIDIREVGSGNAGTTNIMRTLGKKAGFATFFLDILKTFLAAIIAHLIFKEQEYILVALYAGLGVIIGHNWPIFLGFKGGKGVACTLAAVFVLLDWRIMLIAYSLCAIVLLIGKMVSLASISFAISLPILFVIFGYQTEAVIMSVIFMAFIVLRHISNIKRILNGTERKIGSKKEK